MPVAYRDVLPLYGLPTPQTEYRFHPRRKWRIDLAIPEFLIGIEVDGGIWNRGRHLRGVGFRADQEKSNEAQIMGWILLRTTPQDIVSERFIGQVRRALKGRGWKEEVPA